MEIDEDPFPLATSINLVAINLRVMLNAKKVGIFSPSDRVRKVWIPKQYLTYKNNFVAKGRVHVVRKWKKNGRYSYNSVEDSKQEAKNKKFSKEKNVSPREKGMNDPSRRKIPHRFIIPLTISHVQEWQVVQHKKFPQKLTITQKVRMQRQIAMEKRQLLGEMLQGKPKEVENLKEKVMPSLEKTKSGGKAIENVESICSSNKETYLRTILIGINPFSLNYSTNSITLPAFFKLKEME